MKRLFVILFVLNQIMGSPALAQPAVSIKPQSSQVPEAVTREPGPGVAMPSSSAPLPAPVQQPRYPDQNGSEAGYAPPAQSSQYDAPPPTPYSAPVTSAQQPANPVAPQVNPSANLPASGTPNVTNSSGEYGAPAATPPAATPPATAPTPFPVATAMPPAPVATPLPVQQPAQLATPGSNPNPSRAGRTPAPSSENSSQRTSTSHTASPLWKVGSVVLTLLGLLVLVVFTPNFSAFTRAQQALIWSGAACAGIAQLADTFSGLSVAASPAQCMLALAGFGGLTASGVIDSHRNRAASGVLWLAASALVTHSLSAQQPSGAFSGALAGTSALCALALCAVSFSGMATAEVADSAPQPIVPAAPVRTTTLPVATPRPTIAPAPQRRPVAAARSGVKPAGKGVARLVAIEGPLKGQVFMLADGANAAGGDAGALDGNKIHLPGDDQVARLHAIFMCAGNRCTVSDMASATGVYLNGGRVLDERDLMNGDQLKIGGTTFLYQRA